MTTALKYFAASFCAAGLLLSACSGAKVAPQSHFARGGERAPSWSLPSLPGPSVSLASLHGKAVYLNFFATWCHGCNEEVPDINATQQKYRARGLQVVGVDVAENARKAAEFRNEHHLVYPIVIDDGTLRREYDVNGLPVQVFIDRSGTVRRVSVGQLSLAGMRNDVESILQ
jgi:peroxiredoxin